MWMGGWAPLGYDVRDRKLVVNEAEAALVRRIFERFVTMGSATALALALRREGVTTKQGKLVDKGSLYKLLNNRIYVGEAVHKGQSYPGEHAPSSTARSGTRCTPSWARARGSGPRIRGRRPRRY